MNTELASHALLLSVELASAVALGCWVLSLVTREYSWVDRIWSIVPAVYAGLFAWQGSFHPRLVIVAVLATLWAARLTFNFARKGGYAKGGEDYRWAELRKTMSPAVFQVFNLIFIAAIQNAILLAITLPACAALDHLDVPLGPLDVVATALFVALLVGETVADEQQWRFHLAKKARRARGEDGPEFLTTGLFRYSRHPNFFCEQCMWWTLNLFAVASGTGLHWTILGAVVLTGLFHGSTNFTEKLSLAKYPSYADYQKRTSRLVPLPPGR